MDKAKIILLLLCGTIFGSVITTYLFKEHAPTNIENKEVKSSIKPTPASVNPTVVVSLVATAKPVIKATHIKETKPEPTDKPAQVDYAASFDYARTPQMKSISFEKFGMYSESHFLPDEKHIVILSDNGKQYLQILDLENNKTVFQRWVSAYDSSNDGELLASTSDTCGGKLGHGSESVIDIINTSDLNSAMCIGINNLTEKSTIDINH